MCTRYIQKMHLYLPHNCQLGIQRCQATWRKPRSTSNKLTEKPLLFRSEFTHDLQKLNTHINQSISFEKIRMCMKANQNPWMVGGKNLLFFIAPKEFSFFSKESRIIMYIYNGRTLSSVTMVKLDVIHQCLSLHI